MSVGNRFALVSVFLLAEIMAEQGRIQEAEHYYQEVFTVAPRAGGKETYAYALFLMRNTIFLGKQGGKDEFVKYHRETLMLVERLVMMGTVHTRDLSYMNDQGEDIITAY